MHPLVLWKRKRKQWEVKNYTHFKVDKKPNNTSKFHILSKEEKTERQDLPSVDIVAGKSAD